jgi:hypothetical protein
MGETGGRSLLVPVHAALTTYLSHEIASHLATTQD